MLELEVCTEPIASVLDANCTTGPVPKCRTGWRVVGEAKKKHIWVKRISCINCKHTLTRWKQKGWETWLWSWMVIMGRRMNMMMNCTGSYKSQNTEYNTHDDKEWCTMVSDDEHDEPHDYQQARINLTSNLLKIPDGSWKKRGVFPTH